MKKLTTLVLASALLLTMATGCSNGNTDSSSVLSTSGTESTTINSIALTESSVASEQSTPTSSRTLNVSSTEHVLSVKSEITNTPSAPAQCSHNFSAATCTKASVCTKCGKFNRDALGHSWTEATCTSPMTCSKCGKTEGSALGHSFAQGVCQTCGNADTDYVAYGQVKGQITWQYNKVLGTRGDNGAKILIIPINDNVKTFDNHEAAMFLTGTYDSGIMVTKCDGYGNFDFGSNVPVGKYIALIVSENTNSTERYYDENGWLEEFSMMYENSFSSKDFEKLVSFVGYQKYAYSYFTVEPDDTITITHDFGYTSV